MTDVEVLHAPFASADLVAGFSTRRGGISAGPYASLNLGFSSDDDPTAVVANRRRLGETLGIPLEHIVVPSQIHGDRITLVGEADRGRGVFERGTGVPGTDACITDRPGVYLMMTIADCAPVLIYDPIRQVVANAHLGWRGTIAQLGAKVVDRLAAEFGSDPATLEVAVGPAIGPCCYEVGEDVIAAARTAFGDLEGLVRPGRRERPHFDVPNAIVRQLVDAGVKREQIWLADACTACDTSRWYSHRAEGWPTGRMASIIGIKPRNGAS